MSTPEQLAKQLKAIARVQVIRAERDKVTAEAQAKLRLAIIAAWESGAAVRDIAKAAGMTPSRCYQIINDR